MRRVFTQHFDFVVLFESDWYLHLLSTAGVEFGILVEVASNQPDFLKSVYQSQVVVFTFKVENAKAEYDAFKAKNVAPLLDCTVEELGQKHFIIADPAGMTIDILEKTEPGDCACGYV